MIEIRSRLDGSVLYTCHGDLRGTDLSGADLRNADLRHADLRNANLSCADLRNADLSYANLRHADLRNANLSCADLSGANLSGANLRNANLSCADLSGANLRDANLYNANLRGADLSYANLRHADLRNADLSCADLSYANLSGANLCGTDLRAANFHSTAGVAPERVTPLLSLYDQPGAIRLYKLVNQSSQGPTYGGITYTVGETYSVANADTDASTHCAAGINVATLDWCLREWREGYRILIVEFTADDIAAIPTATDGKLRLHRCKVVGEKDVPALVGSSK